MNRDVNICENEISLLKERYITTLNNNNLLSDNESDDSDSSLTTINSITTCYTEGSISETESVLTYTSSMLERLNFTPLEETSITLNHLPSNPDDLMDLTSTDGLIFNYQQGSNREQIVKDLLKACFKSDENTRSKIETQIHAMFSDTSGPFQVF